MTDSATQEDQCHQKKIFVGGLGEKTTTKTLLDHFRRYGAIADAVVLRWPDGRPRGFGYVTFSDAASATAVLKDTHKILDCDVDVKRAVPGTNKLFVGGLPQTVTAAEMRQHFEQFGVVSDAVVMIDPSTGRSRGFGFICFSPGQDGADAVNASLNQYNGHYIRGKWIEVKSAAPPHKLVVESHCPPQASAGVCLSTQTAGVEPLGSEPTTARSQSSDAISAWSVEPTPPPGLPAAKARPSESAPVWSVAPPPPPTPPGLGRPVGAMYCEPRWPQTEAAPAAANVRGPAPLPSLLMNRQSRSIGCVKHFDHPGAKFEHKLGHSSTELNADGLRPTSAEDGLFDASMDLRRSLEQLLRQQSEQRTQHAL